MRDFKRMQTDPPAGVSASPIADNVMTWYGNTHTNTHTHHEAIGGEADKVE